MTNNPQNPLDYETPTPGAPLAPIFQVLIGAVTSFVGVSISGVIAGVIMVEGPRLAMLIPLFAFATLVIFALIAKKRWRWRLILPSTILGGALALLINGLCFAMLYDQIHGPH